ncbi:MAG: hypothetical protein WC460_04665 [Patescibacteria group bacterium]
MENHGASEGEVFGKEVGLMSEVIVTGRKVGAGRDFWKAIAHNQKLFQSVVETVKSYQLAMIRKMIIEWEILYREDGIEVDFSDLRIPETQKGFDRLIVIPKGLKIQQAYDTCAKHFPCIENTLRNLDESMSKNDRDPVNGSYAIWVRDWIEADRELKNLSFFDLQKKKIVGITFLEHIQHWRKYYKETGNPIDIKNSTLCSGSQSSNGGVPSTHWDGRRMITPFYSVNFCDVALRAREAVV